MATATPITATFTVTLSDMGVTTLGTPLNSSLDEECLGGNIGLNILLASDLAGAATVREQCALNVNFGPDLPGT